MKIALIAASAALLSGCAGTYFGSYPTSTPPDAFLNTLNAMCGQSYEGRVVTTDAADADFANNRLLMHVRDCTPTEVGIPFEVGEDRSRRWIVTRTETGLRLKHDHRDPEGVIHGYHMYGGDTVTEGTSTRQEFPVDQESIDQFIAGGAEVSTTNVWAIEVHPGRMFAYELRRPNRHLRVEFDLTKPIVGLVSPNRE